MNTEQLKGHIRQKLGKASEEARIKIQRLADGNFRIAVITDFFEGLSLRDRRERTGLEDHPFDLLDLLTPEEADWAGPLPLDESQVKLPFWSEALTRPEAEKILFPSDLEEDLPLPIVATFYSLRGGVGRSSALAYTGEILARKGHRVVCVDMDLEAPGLAALFGHEDQVGSEMGTVPLLLELEEAAEPDFSRHLLRVSQNHELYCLPAGRPDARYAQRLNLIDPNAWYREERNPLRALIEGLQTELPFVPDVLLLDSRTGITPLSGPLLFDLADLAMVVFFPHPQARIGTEALVRALLAARTRRTIENEQTLTPEPRFIVSPIPAVRVPEVVRRYRTRSLDWIQSWLEPAEGRRQEEGALIASEITQFIPYKESIAASDQILGDEREQEDYEPIAEWIERFLPTEREETVKETAFEERKPAILGELDFPTGIAEKQEHLLATFVETSLVRQALKPKTALVLGRKGTGKTAIFRRLRETDENPGVVITPPTALRKEQAWELGKEGFAALDKDTDDWSLVWTALLCLSIFAEWPAGRGTPPPPPSKLEVNLAPSEQSQIELIERCRQLFANEDAGLLLGDWLGRLDRAAREDTLLLFDGLDTGFGAKPEDRARRRRSLEGLFSLYTERGEGLENLRFKVMLREDIWRELRFENKSHLHGRSVRLHWGDRTDFFKVALRQALRSEQFKNYLCEALPGGAKLMEEAVGTWSEQELLAVWTVLVGERMKGGKTTFTRNWVWKRLADGNDDHSPRYLLQLFHSATGWEQREHKRNPYQRSLIRPRALIEVLPEVSTAAVSAIETEEFQELKPLFARLREIGRTPIEAEELEREKLEDLVELAREVGLIEIYEGTEERVLRYRVPELYRYGLDLTRKGQA